MNGCINISNKPYNHVNIYVHTHTHTDMYSFDEKEHIFKMTEITLAISLNRDERYGMKDKNIYRQRLWDNN